MNFWTDVSKEVGHVELLSSTIRGRFESLLSEKRKIHVRTIIGKKVRLTIRYYLEQRFCRLYLVLIDSFTLSLAETIITKNNDQNCECQS